MVAERLAAGRGDQHADGRVPSYLEERGCDVAPARNGAEPLFEVLSIVGVVDQERRPAFGDCGDDAAAQFLPRDQVPANGA